VRLVDPETVGTNQIVAEERRVAMEVAKDEAARCASGSHKAKISNITSVDGFEGVVGLKVPVSIERCAKGEGGECHEAQAQVVSYVAANNLITLVMFGCTLRINTHNNSIKS
jgi:hypothetical protein